MMNRAGLIAAWVVLLGAMGCSAAVAPDGDEVWSDELGETEQELVAPPRPLPPSKPDPEAPMCGGIAAIDCPGAGRCVDNPYDDCDPNAGGADCSGLCTCGPLGPLPLPVTTHDMCGPGRRFDFSPEVCACVPAYVDPCAAVLCKQGTHCVADTRTGRPMCVYDILR